MNSIGIMAAANVNRRLARRAPGAVVVRWSLSIGVAGGAALLLAGVLESALPWIVVPLFIAISMHGLNNPSLTAIALGRVDRSAGSASAVLGTLSMLLGAFVPPLVSLFGVTAAVLGATMLASFALALLLVLAVGPRNHPATS